MSGMCVSRPVLCVVLRHNPLPLGGQIKGQIKVLKTLGDTGSDIPEESLTVCVRV